MDNVRERKGSETNQEGKTHSDKHHADNRLREDEALEGETPETESTDSGVGTGCLRHHFILSCTTHGSHCSQVLPLLSFGVLLFVCLYSYVPGGRKPGLNIEQKISSEMVMWRPTA